MARTAFSAPVIGGEQLDGLFDLTRIRQDHGVSLEEVASETKISVRFLRAIEAAEYEKLPGGIFDINYLRQYAAVVGLSEAVLLQHYRCKTAPALPPEPVSPWRRLLSLAFH